MPRKGRVILPNTPHHIVQRGHNRNAVFIEDRDYQEIKGDRFIRLKGGTDLFNGSKGLVFYTQQLNLSPLKK